MKKIKKTKQSKSPSFFPFLFGKTPKVIHFREGKMEFTVDVASGQKSGGFLDLRSLRKWLASQNLRGLRILNLFSYTGMLGLAAESAGAKEIWNVDVSQGAVDFGKQFHCVEPKRYRFIATDIFTWIERLRYSEKFDLILVDPPSMVSRTSQVPGALKAYRRLYHACREHLSKKGRIVACCCTTRIPRPVFDRETKRNLSPMRLEHSFRPESDHPVGFREGDYLKILVFGSG